MSGGRVFCEQGGQGNLSSAFLSFPTLAPSTGNREATWGLIGSNTSKPPFTRALEGWNFKDEEVGFAAYCNGFFLDVFLRNAGCPGGTSNQIFPSWDADSKCKKKEKRVQVSSHHCQAKEGWLTGGRPLMECLSQHVSSTGRYRGLEKVDLPSMNHGMLTEAWWFQHTCVPCDHQLFIPNIIYSL